MRTFQLEIPGPPVGYTIQLGRFANTKRKRQYVEFKTRVQELAAAAGIPVPLEASKDEPILIITKAFFFNGIHPDPENVHKGVKDALFWKPRGTNKGAGDKYTGGSYSSPLYDKENPRTLVSIFIPGEEETIDSLLGGGSK